MKTQKQRRKFSADFKAKVAIEALKDRESLADLSARFKVHPSQVSTWKRQLESEVPSLFATVAEKAKEADNTELIDRLYRQIGQLQVELDWLKKKSGL